MSTGASDTPEKHNAGDVANESDLEVPPTMYANYDGHVEAAELYEESDTAYIEISVDADVVSPSRLLQRATDSPPLLLDTSFVSSDMLPSDSQGDETRGEYTRVSQDCNNLKPVDLMLLLLKLKHGLTKEATQDFGKMLNVVTGTSCASTSMYNITKEFVTCRDAVQLHHLCSRCASYVGIVSANVVCCKIGQCGYKFPVRDSIRGGHFFFYLPLREQLVDMLQNHNISDLLHERDAAANMSSRNFRNITDGNLYKAIMDLKSTASNRISLTFNCDGVPVFKSSGFSIWPILCVVNEVPPSARSEHILMASLWFGSGKPDMNTFFEPFVSECQLLSQAGFTYQCSRSNKTVNVLVNVVAGVCDAVARPLLQNFKQFNAHYGCSFCFDVGESIEKGRGRAMVYPFNKDMMLRTSDSVKALVEEAFEGGRQCMGIKGPSLLSLLPQFDIVRGMVPDYMHCICLGVVRQIAKLWFEPKNHEEPFYIGKSSKLVDRRLLGIKPPCSVSRTPRSISQLKFWKAHEWLAWLIYYSLIVLKDVLPSTYYSHWAILVDSVTVLLGSDISLSQVVYCERNLQSFVVKFEQLYGKKHCSYNVHQILHLVQSVRDFGPLWSHSAFTFESFNAVLLKMIKGTQGVPAQIFETFCRTRAVPFNVNGVMPRCSDAQQHFILSLTTHKRRVASALTVTDGITLLGLPRYQSLPRSHIVALHCVSTTVTATSATYYHRAVINGEMVHARNYSVDFKRNSYTVKLVDGSLFQVVTFIVADVGNGENCYALGRYLYPESHVFCCGIAIYPLKLNHIHCVKKVPSALVAVAATDIAKKLIFISCDNFNVNFACSQVHLMDCCV